MKLPLIISAAFAFAGIVAAYQVSDSDVASQSRPSITCKDACKVDTTCADKARDLLLKKVGCVGGYEGETIIFWPGEKSVTVPGTACSARMSTADPGGIYKGCNEIRMHLNTIINTCLNSGSNGLGQLVDHPEREEPFQFKYEISACSGNKRRRRETEAMFEPLTEHDEISMWIERLLQGGDGIVDRETVLAFPLSGAESRTVCALVEFEPRLKEIYRC